jgi:putative DNA primase/helicase
MRGKRAMEAYKDRSSFYTIGAVSEFPGFGGILADDFIQIDLDDGDEAKILLKIIEDRKILCSVLKTTRGMHSISAKPARPITELVPNWRSV